MRNSLKKLKKIIIRVFSAILILLVVIVGSVILAINIGEDVPEVSSYEIDIELVRELAQSSMDSLPERINNILIAQADFMYGQVIVGGGFETYVFDFSTFQLVYGDSSTVIIDAVHDSDVHEFAFPGAPFYQDKFDEMQTALTAADLIVSTHEHFDHVGGVLAAAVDPSLKSKLRLTREQRDGLLAEDLVATDDLTNIEILEYETYLRVAPGVVLIKSPGHTPGSQMVFVALEDGSEYMFAGDVVWSAENIKTLKSRSFFSTFFGNEDAEQVSHQIRTISDIMTSEGVHIIVAHDGVQRQQDISEGRYYQGLQ